MSEQQSQKHGVRSKAQKTTTARNAYEPIPPANRVAGAFGEQKSKQTDKDLAYSIKEKESQTNPADRESDD